MTDQLQPEPSEGSRLREHWAVRVDRNGEQVVTIASNMLSGREISPEDAACIEHCAHHLLSFIGKSAALSAEREASDYKSAWEEINRVYDEAADLLSRQPRSYLGWNWVHALVDALKRAPEASPPPAERKG